MVEGARLESVYRSQAYRGFESHPLRQIFVFLSLRGAEIDHPTHQELAKRDAVLAALREFIAANKIVRLPDVQLSPESDLADAALIPHLTGDSPFGGSLGAFRYLFEGEDDLLHLVVVRADGTELSVEEARSVAGFVVPDMPPALIWLKPGTVSQHFYFGHDLLLQR